MKSSDIKKIDQTYAADTYARFDVALTGGSGARLLDADGKAYIDFGSGIAVNTFGAADSKWLEAVSGQLAKISHTSNLYYNQPSAELCKELCVRTGMSRAFLCNSGAEANECAIKAARKYSAQKYGAHRHEIVSLTNSFHGRTVTTLAATGQEMFHKDFQPLTPGFKHAETSQDGVLAQIGPNTCAVILELIQGEGGVNVLDKAEVKAIFDICKERDILVIVDEIQTGNGRTGKLFAYMHYGVTPDIITTAKGLGGGLPIGAAIFGQSCEFSLQKGDHGSTFGGNPVCAAGALSVLSRLDEGFLREVSQKGEYLKNRLQDTLGIASVSGMGLMLGAELGIETGARAIADKCLEQGLLVLTAKTKLRFLPPLNITLGELDEGLSILKNVLTGA